MSSFNGFITEVPGISVDNFECLNKRAYFLSHCHRDHTQGLTSPHLKKYLEDHNVYIYTSELSAAIIARTADFVDVKNNIKILALGKTTVIKLNSTEGFQETYVEVTTIPAGHCFGSIMFLFRTPSKTVLFTGDFRISINDVSKLGQLHAKNAEPISIDKLYVDTTFLDDDYENFPKRSDSIEHGITEMKRWLDRDSSNLIALHPSARFGYEYVFNEIFRQLNMKVYIGDDDFDLYRSYPNLVPGVTNDWKVTRIHKCRNRTENFPHKCLPFDVTSNKFLYVHLSAMKWSNLGLEALTFRKQSEKRLDVCFPTHCSKLEILHFVNYFSPKSVVGFPNEFRMVYAEEKVDIVFKASKRKKFDNKSKKAKIRR